VLSHIKLLILDLDYLIFDSAGLKLNALRQSLVSFADAIPHSAPLPDPDDVEDLFRQHGFRWVESVEFGLGEELMPMVERAYRINERRLVEIGSGQVFTGVLESLEPYRTAGVSLALGADATRTYLMAVSDRHQLDRTFSSFLCTEEFGMGSVDEMLDEAIRLAEVNRSETLVLGSRPGYFRAARDLDLTTIGCGWGIHRPESLNEADYQASTPAELTAAVSQADERGQEYY
jgi:phosphoglycolate phosphatase-like HAD superfamily hydrolase